VNHINYNKNPTTTIRKR